MGKTWLKSNSFTSQFITGHGNFSEKLYGLGLQNDVSCLCGAPETAEHVLKECVRYNEERNELLLELRERGYVNWPEDNAALVQDEKIYNKFTKCCKEILKKKEN